MLRMAERLRAELSRVHTGLWRHGGAGPVRARPRITMGVTKPQLGTTEINI